MKGRERKFEKKENKILKIPAKQEVRKGRK